MSDDNNNQDQDIDAPFQKAVAIKNPRGVNVLSEVYNNDPSPVTDSDSDIQIEGPHITAKGKGKLAEQILDMAFEKGVKVRQDKELTDLLEHFDVDSPIPLEALEIVSDILRHVYIANGTLKPNPDKSDEG